MVQILKWHYQCHVKIETLAENAAGCGVTDNEVL